MAALQDSRRDDSELNPELAYHTLPAATARAFRLLSVHPGPSASTAAVAALTGLTSSGAHSTLASLSRAHLTEAVPGNRERWRMGDLVRAHSQRLSDAQAAIDGREHARNRLLRYYQSATEAADDWLRGLPPIPVPQEFTDRDGALAWLDAERASLIAAAQMAADTGRDQAAKSLPLLMAHYLNFRGLFDDLLAATAIGLDAARRLGDRVAEGEALNNLGAALSGLRRYDEAITAYRDAAAIFRQTGYHRAEGESLTNLGIALSGLRRYDEAITAHRDAAAIFRQSGDHHAEGTALNNLGIAQRAVRRDHEARTAYQDAVAIFRETGDRHGVAMALGNLGNLLRALGRSAEAVTAYLEAADIFRETGDHPRELATLGSLKAVQGDAVASGPVGLSAATGVM
jgi:tetratricopeptide (TPR) repeat protein